MNRCEEKNTVTAAFLSSPLKWSDSYIEMKVQWKLMIELTSACAHRALKYTFSGIHRITCKITCCVTFKTDRKMQFEKEYVRHDQKQKA